jgi:hypothetical protein
MIPNAVSSSFGGLEKTIHLCLGEEVLGLFMLIHNIQCGHLALLFTFRRLVNVYGQP